MADEIDRGQESGEVATRGGDRDSNVRTSGNRNEATLGELGISSQRVSEWREVRNTGTLHPGAIDFFGGAAVSTGDT